MSDGTTSERSCSSSVLVGSGNPYYLTAAGNTLYFRGNNGINGGELWKSDGTIMGR